MYYNISVREDSVQGTTYELLDGLQQKPDSALKTLKKIDQIFEKCNLSDPQRRELAAVAEKIKNGHNVKAASVTWRLVRSLFRVDEKEEAVLKVYRKIVSKSLPRELDTVTAKPAQSKEMNLAKMAGYDVKSESEARSYFGHLARSVEQLDAKKTPESLLDLSVEQKNKTLLKAVNLGLVDVATYLIKAGANVKTQDEWGCTPLHLALRAASPNFKMLEMLLREGADINQKTSQGNTALHLARFIGNRRVVALFRKYGANPAIKNNFGRTPEEMRVLA